MRKLPENVTAYRRTETFSEENVPAALLKDHRTADTVWAKIVVLQGSLRYVIQEPQREITELTPGVDGVIEPGVYHHVILGKGAAFYVEFYE